jgi:hypothetical protein
VLNNGILQDLLLKTYYALFEHFGLLVGKTVEVPVLWYGVSEAVSNGVVPVGSVFPPGITPPQEETGPPGTMYVAGSES